MYQVTCSSTKYIHHRVHVNKISFVTNNRFIDQFHTSIVSSNSFSNSLAGSGSGYLFGDGIGSPRRLIFGNKKVVFSSYQHSAAQSRTVCIWITLCSQLAHMLPRYLQGFFFTKFLVGVGLDLRDDFLVPVGDGVRWGGGTSRQGQSQMRGTKMPPYSKIKANCGVLSIK